VPNLIDRTIRLAVATGLICKAEIEIQRPFLGLDDVQQADVGGVLCKEKPPPRLLDKSLLCLV
jgi:hypothetical protein